MIPQTTINLLLLGSCYYKTLVQNLFIGGRANKKIEMWRPLPVQELYDCCISRYGARNIPNRLWSHKALGV